MGTKNKKYDKNTPQVGDLLVAGKQDKMYFQVEVDSMTWVSTEAVTEMLPAIVIRAEKDEIWLRFPLTGHTHKNSKRRLRFQIKHREFHLQKARKKQRKENKK